MAWDDILNNPRFQQEPQEVKADVAQNYFDQHIASDPKFQSEPPEIQAQVQNNFMGTIAAEAAKPPKPIKQKEAPEPKKPRFGAREPSEIAARPEAPVKKAEEPLGSVEALGKGLVTGFRRRIPEMLGGALEFSGISPESGARLKEFAEKGEVRPEYGSKTAKAFGEAGEAIPASVALSYTLMTAGRALSMVPSPYTKVPGAALVLAGRYGVPAIFGLAQARSTEELGEERGVETGAAPYVTGAIEAGGETLGTWALTRLLGNFAPLAEAGKASIREIVKPTIKSFLKEAPKTFGIELGTEFAQQYGQAAVEKAYDIRPEAQPLSEAVGVLAPTAIMTAFGVGAAKLGRIPNDKKLYKALSDPETDTETRAAAVAYTGKMLEENTTPELAEMWATGALEAIDKNEPIDIDAEIGLSPTAATPENIAQNFVSDLVQEGSLSQEQADRVVRRFAETTTPESTPDDNATILESLLSEEGVALRATEEVGPEPEAAPETILEAPTEVEATGDSIRAGISETLEDIEPTSEAGARAKEIIMEDLAEDQVRAVEERLVAPEEAPREAARGATMDIGDRFFVGEDTLTVVGKDVDAATVTLSDQTGKTEIIGFDEQIEYDAFETARKRVAPEEAAAPETPEAIEAPPLPEAVPPSLPEAEVPAGEIPAETKPFDLEIEKGTVKLDEPNRQIIENIKAEVEAGEAGRRVPVRTPEGEVVTKLAEPSTFPEYFQNKGYRKADVLNIINKIEAGKKLTPKQQATIVDLHEGFMRTRPEAVAELERTEKDLTLTEGVAKLEEGEEYGIQDERISPAAPKEDTRADIEAAESVARRGLRSVRQKDGPDYFQIQDYNERRKAAQKIRTSETKELRQYAEENNLFLPNFEETLVSEGSRGGAENFVYYDSASGRWMKAQNFFYTPTFTEFFDRIKLHNQLFPGTAYRFEGFADVKGKFLPVVSQPHVVGTKEIQTSKLEEMAAEALGDMGFERTQPKNTTTIKDAEFTKDDIVVSDINHQNVVYRSGEIFFVDPIIERARKAPTEIKATAKPIPAKRVKPEDLVPGTTFKRHGEGLSTYQVVEDVTTPEERKEGQLWVKVKGVKGPADKEPQVLSFPDIKGPSVPVYKREREALGEALPVERAKGKPRKADIVAAVDIITTKWRNKPPIKVVSNVRNLPDRLQEHIAASEGEGKIEGLFDPKTRSVYLLSDNIDSLDRAKTVLFHESLGHFGIRGLLGKDIDPVLRQVYAKYRKQAQDIAGRYDFDVRTDRGRIQAAEEVLADLAVENNDPKLLSRVYAKIRNWLRKVGFDIELSDADIRSMLADAAQFVRADRKSLSLSSGVPVFARKTTREGRIEELRRKFERDPLEPTMQEALELQDKEGPAPKKEFGTHREYTEAEKKALSKIGGKSEGESFASKLLTVKERLGTTIRQKLVDQYASLKEISEQGYILAIMSNTSTGALESALKYGKVKLDKEGAITVDETGKGFARALSPLGEEVDDFLAWIAGNRSKRIKEKSEKRKVEASRLSEEAKIIDSEISEIKKDAPLTAEDLGRIKELGRLSKANKDKAKELLESARVTERLFTDEDIDAMVGLAEGKMKDGRARKPIYNKALKELNAFQKSFVDIAVKTGAINEEERATWETDFYVPFYRILEETEGIKGPKTLDSLAGQTAVQRLKGSDVPLNDILQNILMNWNHLLNVSLKNQAATVSLEAAEKVGVATQIREKDKTKNSVFIRREGKKVWYDIHDPLMLESISSLSWEGFNSTSMKMARKFKRIFTIGITASPEFRVANLMRDSIHGVAVSRLRYNILDNVFKKGWSGTKPDSITRARMLAGGGEIHFGHNYGNDPESAKLLIQQGVESETILGSTHKIKKFKRVVFDKWWDRWNEFGSRLENVNRAALYEKRVEEVGHLKASYEARDLMNFTNTGAASSVRILTQVVPFLNARLQGLDKMARAMADREQRGQFLITAGMVSMASIALYLAFKDDDDFREREEWDRDTYWWFKLPGQKIAYRIPKPFEVGSIGTLAERTVEQIVDDEVHGELFAERLSHMIVETLSFSIVPQALQPVLDVYANKNPFTDRPIETLGLQRLSKTERKKVWTSETTIGLSEAMDKISWGKVVLSPVQIQYLLEGYLGWIGSSVLATTDSVFARPLGDFPTDPAITIEDVPGIGRFVRRNPKRNTKYGTLFYEQIKEMNEVYNDLQNYRRLREFDKVKETQEKHREKLRWRRYFNKQQRNLSKIFRQIRIIHASRTLTAEQKRMRIDLLNRRKNRITKMAVERASQDI
jgi:hypothetical protein